MVAEQLIIALSKNVQKKYDALMARYKHVERQLIKTLEELRQNSDVSLAQSPP